MLLVQEDSLDDVLREVLDYLIASGTRIEPSRGPALEQVGAAIEIRHPRARVSRSHNRSKIYSALGEFLWYLSGTDLVEPIEYYIPRYPENAVDGRIEGAYGPRLFGVGNRLAEVVTRLSKKPDSRQAVVQVFDHSDLSNEVDVPCTTTLQFLLRDGHLNLIATMRSNDAYLGLPHDVFAFTMIQEVVARQLGFEVGTYFHFVGSLHLYEKDIPAASDFLKEGWHYLKAMPPMPVADPSGGLSWLLKVEEEVRLGKDAAPTLSDLGERPYWDDLARLLLARAQSTEAGLSSIRSELDDPFYEIYVTDRQVRFEEV